MKRIVVGTALVLFALAGQGAETRSPFESDDRPVARNAVDEAVLAALRKRGISPAAPCSDEVFVRRVFLDVIGTLPTPEEVVAFLADKRKDKRARLVETLFGREEFADYWSLKWCDVLRVKAEFPINLWPNAVQAYHHRVREFVRENQPYDQFARELLTASGSNFRVPAVNFYRATQSREPAALAQAVALTFMGARFESLPRDRQEGMATFFARVAFKRTKEWKEEIVFLSPAPATAIATVFPDGRPALISPDEDPRRLFADWLVRGDNPWFAAAVVNRLWAWLVGRGIVDEPDDIRPDNPPANPKLLTVLTKALVESGYDIRAVMRLILNSRTYQQSPIPRSDHAEAEALFAHYIVSRLDAEVLIDALCAITGTSENYMSAIPEPFTFVPAENRSIALSDGSITSPFLEMFGRPARDTGQFSERNNEPTSGQRLHLLNSRDIQQRIERGPRLARLLLESRNDPRRGVENLYLLILSRRPTDAEVAVLTEYAKKARLSPKQLAEDLVWALINTKEFLYRH